MYKVFDIHTHTYPEAISEKAVANLGRFYNFEVQGKGTYAHLESQAAENNVGGYLLFSILLSQSLPRFHVPTDF